MNFSNNGDLILVRELGERLGFGKLVERHLTERRLGKNTSLPLVPRAHRDDPRRISTKSGDNRTAVDGESCVAPAVRVTVQVAKETSGAHRFDDFEDSGRPGKPAAPCVDT
jgi:hypothetical protein